VKRISRSQWNDCYGEDSSPSEAIRQGALSARRRTSWLQERSINDDPLLPFKIGPVKEREARESGLWLASWDAVIEELANAGDNEEAEG
jgi:hypothetical protein